MQKWIIYMIQARCPSREILMKHRLWTTFVKAIDNFFMRFERIVSKDKKSQSTALCKLNAKFSVSNITMLDTEKKTQGFLCQTRRVEVASRKRTRVRWGHAAKTQRSMAQKDQVFFGEFDPGSGRTLAACLTHASRTGTFISVKVRVANGWVTRRQPADRMGTTFRKEC